MSLHLKKEDAKERRRPQPGGGGQGSMGVKKVYGNECSLMVATRPPGYHSRPHYHASDQIIHVLEGENWWFIEDKAFHCRKGDFLRIPANKIQWDWNLSAADCVVVEAHAPPMIGGASGEGALPLFYDGEEPRLKAPGINVYVEHDFESVERKYNLR